MPYHPFRCAVRVHELIEGGIAVAFRQASVALAHDKGNVRVRAMFKTEHVLQIHLLRSRHEQIHAAYDAVHALFRIVYHRGELVCEQTI